MKHDLSIEINGQDNLSPVIKNAQKALTDLGQSSTKLDDVQRRFNKVTNSTAPLQKKLKSLQSLMAEMNLDNLTHTDVFAQLAEQAGTYSDAIGDARTAISAFANDNMKLQAMAQGFQLITGSASVLTGALGMLGIENEKVEQAMLKVQSAIALVNGVTAVANILNKDSALMLRLKSIRLAANTAAMQSNTASTVANSVATTANNAARRIWNITLAVSKALMGDFTGLVLLGAGALTTYALCTTKSKDETDKNSNSLYSSKRALDEHTEALKTHNKYLEQASTKSGELVGKFMSLKSQWDKLKSTAEKTEWIKNNQNEFNNLGISVGDLTTAERVFVNDTDKVVQALEARAKAMAAQTAMTDAYSKFYKQKFNNANSIAGGGYYSKAKAGDKVDQQELIDLLKSIGSVNKTGGAVNDGSYKMTNGNFILTEKGANALNTKRQQEARERRLANDAQAEEQLAKTLNFYSKETEKATENIKALGLDKIVNSTDKGTKGNFNDVKSSGKAKKEEKVKTQLEIDRENLEKVKKELQQAFNDFNSGLIDKSKLVDTVKSANDYFDKNEIKSKVGFQFSTEDGFEKAKQIALKEVSDLQLSLPEIEIKPELVGLDEFKARLELMAEETKREMEEITNTMSSLGSVFSSLGSAIGGTGGEIMKFAGQSINAIGQLIPQIVTLISAKQAEALASGTASGASMPFPANIAAIAGIVATIAGIFASLPKFESGGVVGGTSYHGDKLLARVNSGELILNKAQQSRLYKAMNSEDFSQRNVLKGDVNFTISGSALKGTLRNYDQKMSKIK